MYIRNNQYIFNLIDHKSLMPRRKHNKYHFLHFLFLSPKIRISCKYLTMKNVAATEFNISNKLHSPLATKMVYTWLVITLLHYISETRSKNEIRSNTHSLYLFLFLLWANTSLYVHLYSMLIQHTYFFVIKLHIFKKKLKTMNPCAY
jgi:hypothetical protein